MRELEFRRAEVEFPYTGSVRVAAIMAFAQLPWHFAWIFTTLWILHLHLAVKLFWETVWYVVLALPATGALAMTFQGFYRMRMHHKKFRLIVLNLLALTCCLAILSIYSRNWWHSIWTAPTFPI